MLVREMDSLPTPTPARFLILGRREDQQCWDFGQRIAGLCSESHCGTVLTLAWHPS